MIIPGAHRIELAMGGLGFAARDARRPDIGPVRPGYLLIPGASTLVPSPPIFDSVVAADGYLTVDVHSPSAVDGYEIGVSATIQPPETWWSTASGHLVQPLAAGTYYLFARAHYQGAYSAWSQYGQLAPGQDEWTLTWADESCTGTDATPYPYSTVMYGHASGYYYVKGWYGHPPKVRPHTAYVNAYGLSKLTAVGGKYGIRIDTMLTRDSFYEAAKAGVAWGFDPAEMVAAPTATPYYGVALWRHNDKNWLGLFHVVNQTATLITEAEVALATHYDRCNYVHVSVQARGNAVTVQAGGVTVISATATGITWSETLTGTGLWYQGSSNYGYSDTFYMDTCCEDYLRVYARDHTGEAETVTPGSPDHNDLDGRSETACHPASAVSVTPSGGIAATDVAAALAELDGEKAAAVHTHADATTSAAGFLSAADKTKLDGVEAGADVTDAANIAATVAAATEKTSLVDADVVPLIDSQASYGLKKWSWAYIKSLLYTYLLGFFVEKATTQTVSLTVAMSTAQKQAAINAIPRYLPNGVNVYIQIESGSHTETAALDFRGFFGGGNLLIQGNRSEADANTLHTTQEAQLDFSATDCDGIILYGIKCVCYVYNLKVKAITNNNSRRSLGITGCNNVWVYYSYFIGTDNSSSYYGHGVVVTSTASVVANSNYFEKHTNGFTVSGCSNLYSYNSVAVAGLGPYYGITCSAARVYKYGTQIVGVGLNENATYGGDIRGAETYWHSANDGPGSTLDSDSVDTVHLSGLCQWGGSAASAPTGVEGKIYKNTSDGKVYIYAGGAWVALT